MDEKDENILDFEFDIYGEPIEIYEYIKDCKGKEFFHTDLGVVTMTDIYWDNLIEFQDAKRNTLLLPFKMYPKLSDIYPLYPSKKAFEDYIFDCKHSWEIFKQAKEHGLL